MRRLCIALGVAAAAFFGATRLRSWSPREVAAREQSSANTPAAVPPRETAGARSSDGGPAQLAEPRAARAVVDAAPALPAPLVTPAGEGRVRAEGRVVVVDELDVEHAEEDGTLTLVLWRGRSGTHMEVPVEAGRWSAEFDPIDRLGVDDGLTLGGRGALTEQHVLDLDWEARPVTIRARWLRPVLLHVRDAATGAALRDVRVLEVTSTEYMDNKRHPSSAKSTSPLVEGGVSPISLELDASPVRARTHDLYVHSPEHAWAFVRIATLEDVERVVELGVGGSLEARVRGDPGPIQAFFRLRPLGQRLPILSEAVPEDGRVALDGLRPGRYHASVEAGPWTGESPPVLGSAELELQAPGSNFVEVLVDAQVPAARAPLSGVVHVPVAFGLDHFYLQIELQGPSPDGSERRTTVPVRSMRPVEDEPGSYSWDAGEVLLGRHVVTVSELEYAVAIEVGRLGATDVRIDVPPPGRLEVEVVDAATGERLTDGRLLWQSKRPRGIRAGGLASAVRDRASGLFAIVAPQGSVRLHPVWKEYVGEGLEEVEVLSEPRAIRIELRRACRVDLRLRADAEDLAWPADWWPQLEALDGGGQERSWASSDLVRSVWLDRPGRYRVRPPLVAGFEPPEPVIVEALEGETVTHVVQLVRER